jgi:hypothetical protein
MLKTDDNPDVEFPQVAFEDMKNNVKKDRAVSTEFWKRTLLIMIQDKVSQGMLDHCVSI